MRYMVIYTLQFSYEIEADSEDEAQGLADAKYMEEDLIASISDPVIYVTEL